MGLRVIHVFYWQAWFEWQRTFDKDFSRQQQSDQSHSIPKFIYRYNLHQTLVRVPLFWHIGWQQVSQWESGYTVSRFSMVQPLIVSPSTPSSENGGNQLDEKPKYQNWQVDVVNFKETWRQGLATAISIEVWRVPGWSCRRLPHSLMRNE